MVADHTVPCDFYPAASNFCYLVAFFLACLSHTSPAGLALPEGKYHAGRHGASPRGTSAAPSSQKVWSHLSVTCDLAPSNRLSPPTAVRRPGHPADASRPAALHHLLHRAGGLHLLQLLQQRADSRAENSSRSTFGTVPSPNPDAGLQDSLLPVECPAVPQRCHSKVLWTTKRK